MSSADIMGRYADVQHMVAGLLEGSRRMRDGSVPLNLKLLEEGYFVVGHELLEIAATLKAHVDEVTRLELAARDYLLRCQALLDRHEQLAERNGLVPAIIRDRAYRMASLGDLGPNVTRMPDGLSREIWRMGRSGGGAK